MTIYRQNGDVFGRHRVISPDHALPQAATQLDNLLPLYSNELLIDVHTLNIDSASFHQMYTAAHKNLPLIENQILDNVKKMGKQQNPVTGSGGMLLGTVADIGPEYDNKYTLSKGDYICTLVSLTLTPLYIDRIKKIHPNDQVDIEGHAILFSSGIAAKIPNDIPLKHCLSLLDVAGAPAQAMQLSKPGQVVLIIGAGKSGLLCAASIRQHIGNDCCIIVTDIDEKSLDFFSMHGLADHVFTSNALNPTSIHDHIQTITNSKKCDLVINTTNIEGTEIASIMACRNHGIVYFFNMATNFQKAALGAEGIAANITMMIGNGYTKGHAKYTLDLYRNSQPVQQWFHTHLSL